VAQTSETSPGWGIGLGEAAISVADLDQAVGFWQRFAEWQVIHRGPVSQAMLAHWKLTTPMRAIEAVMGPRDAVRGFVRLVQFGDGSAPSVRGHARPFDTGGLFDINVRVDDIGAAFARLEREGGRGFSEPLQFHFGPFLVREAAVAVRDGVTIAIIERLAPPLPPEQQPKPVAGIHQVVAVVRDFDTPWRLFTEVLGFTIQADMNDVSPPPGANLLGLPNNIAMRTRVRLGIVRPGPEATGVFELLAYDDASGEDFAHRAHAPNRGILAARYRVPSLAPLVKRLQESRTAFEGPVKLDLPPYGAVEMLTLNLAEGARVDLLAQG
jgi:catechol 2,3-dioxygenase-like lactoylglutathione lyase family enzyme